MCAPNSSVALLVVRAIEEFLLKDSRSHIIVKTPASTALYVLNHKRGTLSELEARFGLTITIEMDDTVGAQHYVIQRGAIAEKPAGLPDPHALLPPIEIEDEDDAVIEADADEAPSEQRQPQQRTEGGEESNRDRKRRRRRRRRGGRDRDHHGGSHEGEGSHERAPDAQPHATAESEFAASESDSELDIEAGVSEDGVSEDAVAETAESPEDGQKKRRRGKRGGKRNRRDEGGEAEVGALPGDDEPVAPAEVMAEEIVEAGGEIVEPQPEAVEPPKKRRASRAKKPVAEGTVTEAPGEPVAAAEPEEAAKPAAEPAAEQDNESARASRRKPASSEPAVAVVSSTPPEGEPAPDQPKRSGWWQRKSFF